MIVQNFKNLLQYMYSYVYMYKNNVVKYLL